MGEFTARGVRIAAISVDPPEVNARHRRKLGLDFPLLSDTKAEVIRNYDLLHAAGGPGGTDIARPAEFLLDSTGKVRWLNLTESYFVRARPTQVLRALEGP